MWLILILLEDVLKLRKHTYSLGLFIVSMVFYLCDDVQCPVFHIFVSTIVLQIYIVVYIGGSENPFGFEGRRRLQQKGNLMSADERGI